MNKSKRISVKLPVTSKMKYDFKYVKEGNKMTDAMKEMYDIFEEDIDQEILENRERIVLLFKLKNT